MKSCCAETTSAKHATRAWTTIPALLAATAFVLSLSAGCGGGAPLSRESAGAPASSVATGSIPAPTGETAHVETEYVAQTQGAPSLHERVMAEQGRTAAERANRLADTTSSDPPQSTTTTSAVPSVEPDPTTTVILSGGQTPLTGVWSGTAEQLASYLLGQCPSPCFTVSTQALADYYVRYCAEAGLRADLLWAQMIKETGYGMYGGAVVPEQNNYAGIGATGGGEPGAWFQTAEAGVMAHVAHMVAYVYPSSPVPWADGATDPRFDFVNPRGVASVLADLNGRWAVPGTTYGESIEAIAWAINAG